MDTTGKLYHIVPVKVWERALIEARYKPDSLKTEGFIHMSNFAQVVESAELHFKDHDEVVVVSLFEKKCKPKVKWEPGRGEELFPHYYGDFPWDAVETSRMLIRGADGKFEWE